MNTNPLRRWCYTSYDMDFSYENMYKNEYIRYHCYGIETCPTTGRKHHQGYIALTKSVRLSGMKKLIPGAHFEACKGNEEQNINYCAKDGDFHEWGQRSKKGERTDLMKIKDKLCEGRPMKDVIKHCNNFGHIRYAENLIKYTEKKRNWLPEVYWYWGPTGTGKTRTAIEEAGEDFWISGKNLKWWDGYDAHENIILDDFRGDFCTFHELLRILDRYPYRIEVKGGSRELLAKKIWITAPFGPCATYTLNCSEKMDQLLRRISTIRYFPVSSVAVAEVSGNTEPTLHETRNALVETYDGL